MFYDMPNNLMLLTTVGCMAALIAVDVEDNHV